MGKKSHRQTRENRKSTPGHRLNKKERIALKNKRSQNLQEIRVLV